MHPGKGGIKLHTMLDIRGAIPTMIHFSEARRHDVHLLDDVTPEPGAIYLMDRAYLDFERLYRFHCEGAFFLMRTKKNLRVYRRYSHLVNDPTLIGCDQTVMLARDIARDKYPCPLRRVRVRDPDDGQSIVLLTNHFALPATTVGALYVLRPSSLIDFILCYGASKRKVTRAPAGDRNARCVPQGLPSVVSGMLAITLSCRATGEHPPLIPTFLPNGEKAQKLRPTVGAPGIAAAKSARPPTSMEVTRAAIERAEQRAEIDQPVRDEVTYPIHMLPASFDAQQARFQVDASLPFGHMAPDHHVDGAELVFHGDKGDATGRLRTLPLRDQASRAYVTGMRLMT